MKVADLDSLFRPKSIAVVGATERADSMGSSIMQNLLQGQFSGPILPVNPNAQSVFGVFCYPTVAALPLSPELAIICTPPDATAQVVYELGKRGTGAAIITTMDPDRAPNNPSTVFRRELLEAARPSGIRILGPGSTGIQVPALHLNASWIQTPSTPGKVALLSQSGSFAAGLVEWAHGHGQGFSHVVTTGDAIDIDSEEILDYFATKDPLVRSVLLYLRSVNNARRFMSAARAIARSKTIIAIRGGRRSPAGNFNRDAVYDAVIRRAGMLQVFDTEEIFSAIETLSHVQPRKGEKLVVLSNGVGPGEMATDAIAPGEASIPTLNSDAQTALRALSPLVVISNNLVSIGRDANAERYRQALNILLKHPQIDALLVMHTPTSVAQGDSIADTLIECARNSSRNILACWIGQERNSHIHQKFSHAGIALLATPDQAARAFLHLVHFNRNQDMLLEAPAIAPTDLADSNGRVRKQLQARLGEHLRHPQTHENTTEGLQLNEQQSLELLSSFGISTVNTRVACGVENIADAANHLKFPLALQRCADRVFRSHNMSKLALDICTAESLIATALEMRAENGDDFMVQEMVNRSGQYALQASVEFDHEFGPVISLGIGGTSAHLSPMQASALPPLNMPLATELINRSRVLELLGDGINKEQLGILLVKLSQLITEIPEVNQLEINPLLAGPEGVTAMEARIQLTPVSSNAHQPRLAIRPYPKELEQAHTLKDGTAISIRPVRPEDEQLYIDFFKQVAPGDMFLRFFRNVAELPRAELAKMVQIDYDREMAFLATATTNDNDMLLGEVRTSTLPDNSIAEYSIVLRNDMKGTGLGRLLMQTIIDYTTLRHTESIVGTVLAQNNNMLHLCQKLGFELLLDEEDEDLYEVKLQLSTNNPPL